MSEPRRWLDDPDGAPDDVRALLRDATPTRAPDAAALARVTERVTVATALGGVTAAGVTWWKVGALTVGLAASVAVLAPRKSHPPPAAIARPVAAVVHPVAAPVVAPSVAQVARPSVAPPSPAFSAARVVRVTPRGDASPTRRGACSDAARGGARDPRGACARRWWARRERRSVRRARRRDPVALGRATEPRWRSGRRAPHAAGVPRALSARAAPGRGALPHLRCAAPLGHGGRGSRVR